MPVAARKSDQEIDLAGGRPGPGPDRAPTRKCEASIEAKKSAEMIDQRDGPPNFAPI
jgi:hypothetical protein